MLGLPHPFAWSNFTAIWLVYWATVLLSLAHCMHVQPDGTPNKTVKAIASSWAVFALLLCVVPMLMGLLSPLLQSSICLKCSPTAGGAVSYAVGPRGLAGGG